MITIQISSPWHICTPTLFRYLPATYVGAFFNDGSLRLSSFAVFKKHEDEQRFDDREGRTMFVHVTQQGGGQSLSAWGRHGLNAYVLCATMRHDEALMRNFGCDSYIRINDPTKFAVLLAKHVPGFLVGAEGPCLYQDKRIIERDLGYIDLDKLPRDPSDPTKPDKRAIDRFINDQMQLYPFFLKPRPYANQVEYRLLWVSPAAAEGFLDIKVPEAIPLCSRPNSLTD